MPPIDASPRSEYILTFERRPDHLYVVLRSNWQELGEEVVAKSDWPKLEDAISIWQRIAREFEEFECDKLLVYRDVPKILPIEVMFWLRSEFSKMGFRGCRIAIVDPHHQNVEINNFADTVSQNRGVETRTFLTMEAAEEWLFGK
jgi:hypothetical protein